MDYKLLDKLLENFIKKARVLGRKEISGVSFSLMTIYFFRQKREKEKALSIFKDARVQADMGQVWADLEKMPEEKISDLTIKLIKELDKELA